MENKTIILALLLPALQATDNLSDLKSLEYEKEKEMVKGTFANGYSKYVNVACDSGTSMIRDVIHGLV